MADIHVHGLVYFMAVGLPPLARFFDVGNDLLAFVESQDTTSNIHVGQGRGGQVGVAGQVGERGRGRRPGNGRKGSIGVRHDNGRVMDPLSNSLLFGGGELGRC